MKSLRSYFYGVAAGAVIAAGLGGVAGVMFRDAALARAAEEGSPRAVMVWRAAGANVQARRDAALRRAVIDGQTETVRALLGAGADVCAGLNGGTLYEAESHPEIAAILREWMAIHPLHRERVPEGLNINPCLMPDAPF